MCNTEVLTTFLYSYINCLEDRVERNSNSKTLILKNSSVRSIWTRLTASLCYTTNTNKHEGKAGKKRCLDVPEVFAKLVGEAVDGGLEGHPQLLAQHDMGLGLSAGTACRCRLQLEVPLYVLSNSGTNILTFLYNNDHNMKDWNNHNMKDLNNHNTQDLNNHNMKDLNNHNMKDEQSQHERLEQSQHTGPEQSQHERLEQSQHTGLEQS